MEDIRFDAWADQWLASFSGKANSRRVYATTVGYAKMVFGKAKVRDLDASDVRRFLDHVRAENSGRRRANVATGEFEQRVVAPATLA